MAKNTQYHCQQCGSVAPKWAGRCESCGAWNSIVEEQISSRPSLAKSAKSGRKIDFSPLETENSKPAMKRLKCGISEFDRVTGGGIVPGSVLLIGGDPGIGKSTLLLQLVCKLSENNQQTVYITGEESADQVRLRGQRLGIKDAKIGIATATNASDIAETIRRSPEIELIIIDSIQTMYLPALDSAPGTVSQVRAAAQELIQAAKTSNTALIFVGHVTKDGAIAGPRVLEHMVDCVLHFEGDRSHHFRILRGIKNRFGATDEIGVFEMTAAGLQQITNPSELFLAERKNEVAGTAVFAGIEGSRPLLVEIEALVAPSPLASPRRNVVGWDSSRLAMLTAVLEARCGLPLSGRDIFLNVAGGMKIQEPAADLAVAAALISSVTTRPLPSRSVFFGEVALSAEIRQVSQIEQRLKEAEKLGFEKAFLPKPRKKTNLNLSLDLSYSENLSDFIDILGGIS
ncbi:DNA repair protein RadA [Alphaproteobacteria bacterium]|jgi:DNA repair protein RadA/Sms|nr:DNA repair protein RadA [Alphaproteobacteria bacterium]MDA9189905.1 DNA repair protein RadA [Alphaproteobacteria bacterium]MDA9815995.1 DNA repair protein RadA [Alphaproteobacteria bacterium]